MKLYLVGIGPGSPEQMTRQAEKALEESDLIVGYPVYVDLIRSSYSEKEFITTPMRQEEKRCRIALDETAKGKTVSVVCSGDAGVYGMAGLVLELCEEYPSVEVEVIAGVTAACGGAAVLGAPLMHDFAVISLSDLLTPWELIEKRIRLASESDFVLCFYNPSSRKRKDYLRRACDIILESRSPRTVCGYVRNIARKEQEAKIMTLAELKYMQADMFTTVYIGNSQTVQKNGRMVTPRGYHLEG